MGEPYFTVSFSFSGFEVQEDKIHFTVKGQNYYWCSELMWDITSVVESADTELMDENIEEIILGEELKVLSEVDREDSEPSPSLTVSLPADD